MMIDHSDPIVMWQFKDWRCEYLPDCESSGKLVVYFGPHGILERKCGSGSEARARAMPLRVLAEKAHRRSPIRLSSQAA